MENPIPLYFTTYKKQHHDSSATANIVRKSLAYIPGHPVSVQPTVDCYLQSCWEQSSLRRWTGNPTSLCRGSSRYHSDNCAHLRSLRVARNLIIPFCLPFIICLVAARYNELNTLRSKNCRSPCTFKCLPTKKGNALLLSYILYSRCIRISCFFSLTLPPISVKEHLNDAVFFQS